jgi:hypothetical protein
MNSFQIAGCVGCSWRNHAIDCNRDYFDPAPADSQKQPAGVEQMCDELAKMRDYGWYKDKFENCMYFQANESRAARANGPK